MSSRLERWLERHRAYGRMKFVLDEHLGTLHGVSWEDFVLLADLESGGRTEAQLAASLGLSRLHLYQQMLPLEKLGLVARSRPDGGERVIELRRGGVRVMREARETASSVCGSGPWLK